MPTKILKFSILIGALIISGLFFFLNRKTEPPVQVQDLKPSQLNFTRSNKIGEEAPAVEVNTKPEIVISPKLSELNMQNWNALGEILKSGNDNDERINTTLKHTDQEFHKSLYERYSVLNAENRNARGLLVFLIARDLKSVEDAEFLTRVYQEEPCMSLEDCKMSEVSVDPHFSGMNQTTLNYPQLTGLYQLEQQLKSRPELLNDPQMRATILDILKNAENFNVPVIQERAQALRRKFGL